MKAGIWGWAAAALVAGTALVHPGILTFRRVPGDPVDTRLHHALLEHGARAWAGQASFWDPPFFHPARNTAAYTETLSGTLPLYAPWRALGASPGAAYSLWFLSCTALNVAAAFWLLAGPLGHPAPAAALGAFLFAFGTARSAHLSHPQLLPGFFLAFAAGALVRLDGEGSPARLAAWSAAAAVALAAQLWTCFYVAWFAVLGGVLVLLAALADPASRVALCGFWRRRRPFLVLAAVLGAALVAPFARHALAAARELGFRDYDEAEIYLPRPASWAWPGAGNWIGRAWAGRAPFDRFPDPYEHAVGLGLVSTAIVVAGLWGLRKSPWGRSMGISSLGLVLLTLGIGGASLWALVYLGVPGAGAVRVVARVANVLLLPAAIGASAWAGDRGRLAAALSLVCVLEQARTVPQLDVREEDGRVARLAERVDRNAAAFLWVGADGARGQVDAMWAALRTGVPTLNGYSGNEPPGWPFSAGGADRLRDWCSGHGIDPDRVQVLR